MCTTSSIEAMKLSAFERETLLADVLGVQEALETFGFGDLLQDMALAVGVESRHAQRGLEALLDPRLAVGSEICMNSAAMERQ